MYTLQKLVLHSNELHKKSVTGFDALHVAAHHNRVHYCQFLLAQVGVLFFSCACAHYLKGFDKSSKTASGLTARDLAVEAKAVDVVKFLDEGVLPARVDPQQANQVSDFSCSCA